ncbi:biotin/lipoyl-binding carrier protein [Cumulibacter soli]|uniref:biotin/lipoyl-binding carrier protein n=1 Tax=Cumulibacter soli TaxID=2546344 RepID=UPI001067485D|nr:biotin/lipoyl-binding carrier protein [Cumulibacter soli]
MTHEVRSEMPGNVWRLEVSVGQAVNADDVLLILESMKMEIPVHAPTSGTVRELPVSEGDVVEQDTLLLVMD